MRISIRHETVYDYAEPAAGVVMRLRLMPKSNNGQSVERWSVSINGKPVDRWIANGYGDHEALWRPSGRVESVTIVAEGDIATTDRAGIIRAVDGDPRPQIFLRETDLTQVDAALAALGERAYRAEGRLASLHALCILIHDELTFVTGSTTVETSAAQALAQGKGVCQDLTHIFIAAARSLAIPTRYVVGYLRDPERPDSEHDSHAWAEAWVESIGWIGFDCTLGRCPMDGHVRISCGLDAADAAPIRGVMVPVSETKLSHDVQIATLPLEGSSQAQTQQ